MSPREQKPPESAHDQRAVRLRLLGEVHALEEGLEAGVGAEGVKQKQRATVSGLRRWISIAETHSRDSLRARVRKALGRSPRPQHTQAERVQAYLLDAMPDLESRALADRFFTVGARYVGSDNAIATLIAAFQEALGTWEAHVTDARDDDDHAGGDDRD